jgi:hypothetical protein
MLEDTLSMSERLACKAVGLARSTYRRLPVAQTPADPDADMRAWLRSYATRHPCHGFRPMSFEELVALQAGDCGEFGECDFGRCGAEDFAVVD